MSNLSTQLIDRIRTYDDPQADPQYATAIESVVRRAVSKDEPLRFLSFTCSTIQSEYLWSPTPWLYVNTDPAGNNLEPDLGRIANIVESLCSLYPRTELRVLIGNTDPYYIYLRQFKDIPVDERRRVLNEFIGRWKAYRENFSAWISAAAPSLSAEVVSWFEFEKEIERSSGRSFEDEYEKTLAALGTYFPNDLLAWELDKLQGQFGPGKYFERIEAPSVELLRDWIRRKFAEYAVQGVWIYENIPNVILIQNEKPARLRSAMYQPIVRERFGTVLPIAHFLGAHTEGYQ